nr:metallopeptidase TldD-related protein [Variibacter gotjawalensis]
MVSLTERLVEAARRAGADAADAIAVRSMALGVQVREGAVEESERSEGDDFGLRVLVGKRQAVVSSNDPRPDGLAALAERAVAMAKVAPEDPYAGLADAAQLAKTFPNLDLLDPILPSVIDLEDLARAAEGAALSVKGVSKSGGASASAGIGGLVLTTSHGFQGAYLGSSHSVSALAIAGEGTGMERDYDYSQAPHRSDLMSPELIGRNAGERAIRRVNPRKTSTHRVPVVYDARAATSLIGHLVSAINGAAIARKTSFLSEKLGQKIFDQAIRIVDDPFRVRGLRSRPFDAEGIAGQKRFLIDDGVLQTWLLDCATARELGLQSTGHASRGVSSVPSPSSTNLHMEAGSESPGDMIRSIEQGLFITDLIGSGANIVSGDYSRGASGFWIENGELTYPVSEITIAGNLNDMLRSLTPANDLEFRYASNSPTVRVEGLTIAGR